MNALRREAVRIYRRYEEEIVWALNLCPWAERARHDERVLEAVVLASDFDEDAALDAVRELAESTRVEVGLVLFPRLATTSIEFERFVARLVKRDAERHEIGTAPFAMAAFHPDARPDLEDGERLIPFLRRTPDPTIQLIRSESLDRVREGFHEGTEFVDVATIMATDFTRENTMPLRERIARANLKTVKRVGTADLERRFAAIREDRDRTYAALAEESRSRAPRIQEP